jgi:predicted RNase H-like nuclease (RuvC/YqgF family)
VSDDLVERLRSSKAQGNAFLLADAAAKIEELRDALDDAIKRNEALEAALKTARETWENIEVSGAGPGRLIITTEAYNALNAALTAMEPKP